MCWDLFEKYIKFKYYHNHNSRIQFQGEMKERGKIMALQHNDEDLDWAYRPYLKTNTNCNYDCSKIEGSLERE